MNIQERIASRLQYAASHNAESTQAMLKSKYKTIGCYFSRGVSQQRIDKYIQQRVKEGKMPSTINYELDCLKAILLPEDRIKIKKLRDRHERKRVYLTEEELAKVLKRLDDDVRNIAMVYLYTGVRRKELYAITPDDLKASPGFIRIKNLKTMTTPMDHYRLVPIRQEIKDLFPIDKKVTPRVVNYALEKASKDLGLPIKVTIRTLRATFASQLIQHGVAVETVSKLLGHSNTNITLKHYAHLATKNLEQALSQLPSFGSTEDA